MMKRLSASETPIERLALVVYAVAVSTCSLALVTPYWRSRAIRFALRA